jgi:hypothetical protein
MCIKITLLIPTLQKKLKGRPQIIHSSLEHQRCAQLPVASD